MINLIALRDGAVDCPIVEASAAKDSFRTFAEIGTPIRRDSRDVLREGVLTPLPDVARHVVDAQLVRGLLRNLMGVIAPSPVVPSHKVDVVAAAEAEPVSPMGTAAR